ncbi:hypothetical protein AMTR_s00034p00227900 [Amborella trichopoda]|uniref:Uncharacterized protein n=1 Tax=Amborella trichopoda TaxID=13333 RepID=W1PWT0_AMBTC|nr:hypothetical protein AMTR_s00034p00227900 [Amborella trichopoda]
MHLPVEGAVMLEGVAPMKQPLALVEADFLSPLSTVNSGDLSLRLTVQREDQTLAHSNPPPVGALDLDEVKVSSIVEDSSMDF